MIESRAAGAATLDVVARMLDAVSARDTGRMMACLAPDVVCRFPTAPPDGPRSATGVEQNRQLYQAIRPIWREFAITRRRVDLIAGAPQRFVAEFGSAGLLLDGSSYANSYVVCGRVRDGLIAEWVEFCDPAPIVRGFAVLQQVLQQVLGGNGAG